jgi:two-component system response regulator FixJ
MVLLQPGPEGPGLFAKSADAGLPALAEMAFSYALSSLGSCKVCSAWLGGGEMPTMEEPEIYIVDDDPGLRSSILKYAESASLAARAYESAEDFLAKNTAAPKHPGCLVLDIRMPGMGGIELLRRLRTNLSDLPVILVSGHADVPATIRGMKLGAVDLLIKPVDLPVLFEAIKRSLKISEDLHRQRAEAISVSRRFEHLSARELELLTFVVDGHANKQIAVDMHISIKTVANHRASLMTKTGAANAADLARLFTMCSSNLSRKSNPPSARTIP